MNKFWEIFRLAKNYKLEMVLALIYNLLNSLLSLFTFAALAPILRIIFQVTEENPVKPVKPDGISFNYWYDLLCYEVDMLVDEGNAASALVWICVATVVLALVKNFVYYLGLRNIATIRTSVIRDLRVQVYAHLVQLSIGYFSNERKGDIISRLTNDLLEIEHSVIGAVESLVKSPIMLIASLIFLFAIDWRLTLFSLIFLPLSGWLISRIAKSLKNAARRGKDALGVLMTVIEETLSGIRIVKAFSAEEQMKKRFEDENENYFRLMMKLYKREYLASPMSEFISIIVISILLYFGGQLILAPDGGGFMDGSLFVVYLIIFSQIIPPVRALSDAVFKVNKGAASVDRINEITDAPIDIKDKPGAQVKTTFDDEIRFENIRFSYEDELVIDDVSFSVKKGETIALVGPSGGGKSTLANLAVRFYDVDSGQITVDGIALPDLEIKSLRSLMGVVTQESILFNDSVTNNIVLGSESFSLEDVKTAADVANATEFVERLEGGFNFNIGDEGGKLSGGQKQRLSIARAIFKNPPILILDEATSALDTQSEKLVQEAINKLMAGRTSLVIAHRLSTIQNADRILVIEGGKVAESGSHSELMQQGGLYKKLVEMQEFD